MDIVIRSYYRQRPGRVTVSFTLPSLAQQHFKEECDINHIMKRYRETGMLVDPLQKATAKPQFGDFSTSFDFMEAQNIVARARESFDAMPSNIRERFGNNPAAMLAFMENEENYEEAVKLGLVEKRPDPTPSPTPSASPISATGTESA